MDGIANEPAAECPGRDELLAFSTGRLDDTTLVTVAKHLSNCDRCQDLLETFDDDIELFASPLRDADPLAGMLDEPEFERLQSRAKAIDIDLTQGEAGFDTSGEAANWSVSTNRTPRPAPVLAKGTNRHDTPEQPDSAGSPEKIGRFFVLRKLGSGGFATVYLAKDPDSNQLVAIKVPRRHKLPPQESLERFLKEARTAAELRHESIVQVYDWGREADGSCYVIMQYIEGCSLKDLLESERLSCERTAELIADVSEALHEAHQHRIYHRDVKPANVLLDKGGKPYLADFGLAILDEDRWARKDERAGTYAYMSPEQVRGETQFIDGRTDVWSLGVTLFQMLTRTRPFSGDSVDHLFAEISNKQSSPRVVDDNVPPELDRICRKCLEKQVNDRYTNALDLASDLRYWRENQQLETTTDPQAVYSAQDMQYGAVTTETESKRKLETKRGRASKIRPVAIATALLVLIASVAIVSIRGLWQRPGCALVDEVAELGVPFSLLEYPPEKLLWPSDAHDTEFQYDADNQRLQINETVGTRLVKLSETSAKSFKFDTAMSSSGTWDGYVGVFWGYLQTKSRIMFCSTALTSET